MPIKSSAKKKSKYSFFVAHNKIIHNVNLKKYLINILSPTSKNTKYYQTPPENKISNIQIGRILLQTHQIISLVNNLGYTFKNKSFLDIGCGNGMIPRLISSLTDIKYSYGIDPFLDGEHTTSWPKHNQYKIFMKIIKFLKKNKYIDFLRYKKFLNFENFTLQPKKEKIIIKKKYHYIFKQLSGLSLDRLKKKFDIIYLKSIEHFNHWDKLFKKLKNSTRKGGLIILKHRSFYSYLGPHRYSTTGIPWGHLVLNEKDYKKYVKEFHKDRYDEMVNFYYKGLTYPRHTVGDLIKFATLNSLCLKYISIDPPHYRKKTNKFVHETKNFWAKVKKINPDVSSEEVLSGIYHIVLEKI